MPKRVPTKSPNFEAKSVSIIIDSLKLYELLKIRIKNETIPISLNTMVNAIINFFVCFSLNKHSN